MKPKVVIALGGNALGNNPQEQLSLVKQTAKSIVAMVQNGVNVIITHGNGPQVGDIHIKTNYPFPESGAMSQGYIGYHLQQAIKNELQIAGLQKEVIALVTQVVVDAQDPAFRTPTKPVGRFYTLEEIQDTGFPYTEDAGRGYRRVVPSPVPQEIIEINTIKQLVEAENIIITCGGGGIPVVRTPQGLEGIAAVIDKDQTSAKLALDLQADKLIILTAVPQVCINFNKPNQQALEEITVSQAHQYITQGQFAPGSMLPKIEAALMFLKKSQGVAIITSLENANNAILGLNCTTIVNDK